MRQFITFACLAAALLASPPAPAQQTPASPPGPGERSAAPLAPTPPTPTPPTPALLAEELRILPAGTHRLEEFRWLARPLAIFADSPVDPRFVQQMEFIHERPADLIARDVVVIVDTAPDARSPIREALRPRGFALVLIGKDGQIYMRRPLPQTVREIVRSIDKMPIRQEEMRAIRGLE